MRSRLLFVAVLVSCYVGLDAGGAQGTISFDNLAASAEQKIYIDEWLNPAALAPGGRQFLVALYFAPISAGESSLTQVGPATGFIGDPNQRYGTFSGGTRTVTPDNWGGAALFQVKGWEAAYGNTHEEAAANSAARRGESPVFIADTSNPQTLEPIEGLINSSYPERPFRGFVIAVPEPSTGILIFAGAGAAVVVIRPKGRRGSTHVDDSH